MDDGTSCTRARECVGHGVDDGGCMRPCFFVGCVLETGLWYQKLIAYVRHRMSAVAQLTFEPSLGQQTLVCYHNRPIVRSSVMVAAKYQMCEVPNGRPCLRICSVPSSFRSSMSKDSLSPRNCLSTYDQYRNDTY